MGDAAATDATGADAVVELAASGPVSAGVARVQPDTEDATATTERKAAHVDISWSDRPEPLHGRWRGQSLADPTG